jgi:hypothetical protein
MKRPFVVVFLILGLVLIFELAMIVRHQWPYGEAVPPAHVSSLREYLEWRPESTFFLAIRSDQGLTLVVEGRWTKPFFNSGPAAYAFDEKGKLLDWTSERGDGPFQGRWWPRGCTTERLSKGEALSRFGEV